MGNNLGFYNKVRAKKKFLGLGEISGWGEVRNKILVWGHNFRLVAKFCVRGDILNQGKILEKNKLEKIEKSCQKLGKQKESFEKS